MTNISASALFHFTPTQDRLFGILTNGFYPHYCFEECRIVDGTYQSRPVFGNAIPMVCFCDIPLSQIKNHVQIYGYYGVGLSKDWGNRNRLNPVLYTTEFSIVSKSIDTIIETAIRSGDNLPLELRIAIFDLVRYAKPYAGDFRRNGKLIENVRFYDEREWRYVPRVGSSIDRLLLRKEEFDDDATRARHDEKLRSVKLSFEPSDIKYIIVRQETEISATIKALREANSEKYDQQVTEILTSEIITTDQILQDF